MVTTMPRRPGSLLPCRTFRFLCTSYEQPLNPCQLPAVVTAIRRGPNYTYRVAYCVGHRALISNVPRGIAQEDLTAL